MIDLYLDTKPSYTDSLMHHGIKGMKWGIRRYQNEDGTLTRAGRIHQAKLAAQSGENYRGPNTDKYRRANASADRGDILIAKGKNIDSLSRKRAASTTSGLMSAVAYGREAIRGGSTVASIALGNTKIADISTVDIARTKMYVDFALRRHYDTQINDIKMADKRRNSKSDTRWAD